MSDQPNILVILTDQQTQQAVSAHGNPYLFTPHMDALVHRGVSFENSYCTAPVCSPSRASLFSGRMPHETGVEATNKDLSVKPEIPTLGDVFQQSGYQSFYAGKWHVGPDYIQGTQMVADRRGFDFLSDEYPAGVPRECGTDTDPTWTDQAVDFLNRFGQRDPVSDQPFLLCVSLHNPHDICYWVMDHPRFRKRDLVEIPIDAELPPLPSNFRPIPDEPEFVEKCRRGDSAVEQMNCTTDWDETEYRRYLYAYYRLTERVDHQIGRVLTALDENGLTENTLVSMISDHGEGMAAHQWVTKMMLYEEPVTVPFVICWKGMIPAGRVDRSQGGRIR